MILKSKAKLAGKKQTKFNLQAVIQMDNLAFLLLLQGTFMLCLAVVITEFLYLPLCFLHCSCMLLPLIYKLHLKFCYNLFQIVNIYHLDNIILTYLILFCSVCFDFQLGFPPFPFKKKNPTISLMLPLIVKTIAEIRMMVELCFENDNESLRLN